MVQVIGQGRTKLLSKSQQFAKGVGEAVETGKEYLNKYQRHKELQKENEVIKNNLGVDLSGVTEPETRHKLIVESLKGRQDLKKATEIEQLKGDIQKENFAEKFKQQYEQKYAQQLK